MTFQRFLCIFVGVLGLISMSIMILTQMRTLGTDLYSALCFWLVSLLLAKYNGKTGQLGMLLEFGIIAVATMPFVFYPNEMTEIPYLFVSVVFGMFVVAAPK